MGKGRFEINLEFEYSPKRGMMEMRPRINEVQAEEADLAIEPGTHIDTKNISIILTKNPNNPNDEKDPCVWVWDPIAKRYYRLCW